MISVHLTIEDGLEAFDRLLQGHQLARVAGEDLCDLEWLGQETLDLTGAGYRQLVLLRQLIHSQDGDDVLQRLVILNGRDGRGGYRRPRWNSIQRQVM